MAKGYLPLHREMDDLAKMKCTVMLPCKEVNSSLGDEGISAENYVHCPKVRVDGEMKTLRHFLVWRSATT